MPVPFRTNRDINPEFYSLDRMENLFQRLRDGDPKLKLMLKEEREYGKVCPAGIRYLLETEDGQDSFWVFQVEKTFPDNSPSQVFFVGPECRIYVATVLNRLTYACSVKYSYKLTESYLQALRFDVLNDSRIEEGKVKVLYYSSEDRFGIYFSKEASPDEGCRKAKILSACLAAYQFLSAKGTDRYILTNYTYLDANTHYKTVFSQNKDSHEQLLKL